MIPEATVNNCAGRAEQPTEILRFRRLASANCVRGSTFDFIC